MIEKRSSGILFPIFSLPNKEGIGTLGNSAYEFINFLEETQQSFWQILPIGYTSYGNSPYQSFSSFAGNPYFIDLEQLVYKGWLTYKDIQSTNWDSKRVNYQDLWEKKYQLLYKAFKNNKTFDKEYLLDKFSWIDDFSTFMGLKKHYHFRSRIEWDEARTKKDMSKKLLKKIEDEKLFHLFLQQEFFEQWFSLKEYAKFKDIQIIGDIPIFVAEDSADVWANPEYFLLDDNGNSELVAGVPPDYFSETGQLWGNPLYHWKNLEKDNFTWWIDRIKHNSELFDWVRIDHFRGFESYWGIPSGQDNAINGKWIKAPGEKFFTELFRQCPDIKIIAEDLGIITPEVTKLMNKFNLPGMKVLQFGFDEENSAHLPENVSKNTLYYTGTHDNDTTEAWSYDPKNHLAVDRAKNLLSVTNMEQQSFSTIFIEKVWESDANIAITTMQDILSLDSTHRINTPSTNSGNWEWRLPSFLLEREKAWLKNLTINSKRKR